MAKSITIPKTPRSAYNPSRKVSTLLKAHIANLEATAQRKVGTAPAKKPRTEGQASAYIAELTRQLHPKVEADAIPPAAPVQPPAAGAQPPRTARTRSGRRTTKTPRRRRAGTAKK